MTVREDILTFAADHPVFQSRDIIGHLAQRGTVNPANITTLLRAMATKGDLIREPVPGTHPHRPRYQYRLPEASS